jgi:hypothetical protein
VDIPRKNIIRNTNAATLAVFWGEFIFISSSNISFNLFVAHVLQNWQSSVIFRTASPKVRKNNPLFCFSRQGSDRRWIESLGDKPDRKDHFLNAGEF